LSENLIGFIAADGRLMF